MYKEKIQSVKKISSGFPLLQEVEIIYSLPKSSTPLKIHCSQESYEVFKEVFDARKIDYKEMFFVLLLNHAGYCLAISNIGIGSTTGVVVNIKEIFQLALKVNATGIILAHNHPSGNLEASTADLALTQKVKTSANCLDMKLLDHIIITSRGYLSFADEGMI